MPQFLKEVGMFYIEIDWGRATKVRSIIGPYKSALEAKTTLQKNGWSPSSDGYKKMLKPGFGCVKLEVTAYVHPFSTLETLEEF